MTIGAGLGEAGERLTGRRDASTEVLLPLWQSLARVVVDVVTVLVVLGMCVALGRIVTYVVSVFLVWVGTDYVTGWLGRRARNPRMTALIYGAEVWFPWVWLVGGLFVVSFLMPFEWAVSWSTREHLLVLERYDALGRVDNVVWRVSAVVRVVALGVGASVLLTAGVVRRHFKHEIDAFYPMRAVDPVAAGVDPRDWSTVSPEATTITVRVESLLRARPTDMGKQGVFPGDRIVSHDISATRAQWEALTRVATRQERPTEAIMMSRGFGKRDWRRIRDGLVAAGLLVKRGNGENGENAGYAFTEAGMLFFRERKWRRA